MNIKFNLNGENVNINVDGIKRLLDVLRGNFNLTGIKEGCGQGECGACSVIVDGDIFNSCCVPVANVNGKRVITIEGLRKTEGFKILDNAFKDAGAVQCGFCIPGMVIASYVLLSNNLNPTEHDIRKGISGNICRCTGYNMIIDAIQLASKRGKKVWKSLNHKTLSLR